MNEHLFSYGTLQKEKVQMELFGRTLHGKKDAVRGYKISTIEIKDASVVSTSQQTVHLIAVPSTPEQTIEGMVLELSAHELRIADVYENDHYKRIKVALQSGKQAWIYVAAH